MSEESYNPSEEPVPESEIYPEGELIEFDDDPLVDEHPPQSAINRPASGARQVSPGEVLSMDFQGSDAAGDFLGLDLEFTEAAQGGETLELADAPISGAAAEMVDSSLSEVMAPGQEYDEAGEDYEYAEGEYAEDEYGDVYDDEGEFDEAGVDGYDEYAEGEFEEGYGDEGFEGDLAEASPKSKRGLLVGMAGAVALVTVGAVFLVPKFLGDSTDGGNVARGPVVRTPGSTTGPDTPVDPTGTDPGVETTDPVDVVSTDPIPIEIDPIEDPPSNIEAWLPDTPDIAETDPSGGDPFNLLEGLGEVIQGEQGTETGTDPLSEATNQLANLFNLNASTTGSGAFPDFAAGEFEWVSDDMLDMIWRGNRVPMEAIFAPARTLMPRVGMVLVHTHTGEIFTGKLYAVGQGMVWLDTNPGRVGLDGETVDRFEHIPVEAAALIDGQVVTGERVRAKVPGGWLYGRVLARGEDQVTLVSDAGARVVLKDADIEPLQNRRPIIVAE